MALYLEDIFAGKGMGCRKEQEEAAVYCAAFRIRKIRESGVSRSWHEAAQGDRELREIGS